MRTIDVQVHAYEHNHPGRPWVGQLHGPQSANGEEMTAAMDAVGVDAAIIVSTFNLYRYDPSYALSVYAAYPDRFRVVKPVDVTDPAIDDVVAEWAGTKGAVGVRIMLRDELPSDPADPRVNRAFAAAGKQGLPVNFLCWGRLEHGTELVRRSGHGDCDRPSGAVAAQPAAAAGRALGRSAEAAGSGGVSERAG
jgi:L-fuconolactonase